MIASTDDNLGDTENERSTRSSVTGNDNWQMTSTIGDYSNDGGAYNFTDTESDSGSDNDLSYSQTSSDDYVVSSVRETGNDYLGKYTLHANDVGTSDVTETAQSSGGDYTLTATVNSTVSFTENGDEDVGSYTRTGGETYDTYNQQSNDTYVSLSGSSESDGNAYYSEWFHQQDYLTVSGNYDTGLMATTETGSTSHTLSQMASVVDLCGSGIGGGTGSAVLTPFRQVLFYPEWRRP